MNSPNRNEIWIYLYPREKNACSDSLIAACADDYARNFKITVPPGGWEVCRVPGKKPFFTHTDHLQFSVSHSGGVWACAFGCEPVGLDVQLRRSCRSMEGIARRFFHPDERAHLEENGYADFFQVWAAKESYVKLTGQGITGSFSDFCVTGGDGLTAHVCGAALLTLPLSPVYGKGWLCLCAHRADGLRIIERY